MHFQKDNILKVVAIFLACNAIVGGLRLMHLIIFERLPELAHLEVHIAIGSLVTIWFGIFGISELWKK
jgi:hypothetical protein